MPALILEKPLSRSTMLFTAHPRGCEVVAGAQIERARAAYSQPLSGAVGKTALVIGSTSFGYGSSMAIALKAAGFGRVIGLGYETAPDIVTKGGQPSVRRSSAGWYLTDTLHRREIIERTYLADGFADATKERVIQDLRKEGTKIDLVVYSVAAMTRSCGANKWTSVLKVIGDPLPVVGLDYSTGQLKDTTIPPASVEEVKSTIKVMGGEDFNFWVESLLDADRLNPGASVTALSYVGPLTMAGYSHQEVLRRVYRDGAIGEAKKDIDVTTKKLDERLRTKIGGTALTLVCPAVVTIASAVIPSIAKYLSCYLAAAEIGPNIPYHTPLDVGILLAQSLYGEGEAWRTMLDGEGRLRLDGDEMGEPVQEAVRAIWDSNNEAGGPTAAMARGLELFRRRHLQLVGFGGVDGVTYQKPCEVDIALTREMRVIDLINVSRQEKPAIVTSAAPVVGAGATAKSLPGGDAPDFYPTTANSGASPPSASMDALVEYAQGRGNDAKATATPAPSEPHLLDPVFEAVGKLPINKASDGTLSIVHRFSREQEALLAEAIGHRLYFDRGLVHPVMQWEAALPLMITDAEQSIRGAKHPLPIHRSGVVHALEPIVIESELSVTLTPGEKTRVKIPSTTRIRPTGGGPDVFNAQTLLAVNLPIPQRKEAQKLEPGEIVKKYGRVVLEVTMSDEMIDLFAEATGDKNPAHFGNDRIAHGMLVFALAIKALHLAQPDFDPEQPREWGQFFTDAVRVNDQLHFCYEKKPDGSDQVTVIKNGAQTAHTMTATIIDKKQKEAS